MDAEDVYVDDNAHTVSHKRLSGPHALTGNRGATSSNQPKPTKKKSQTSDRRKDESLRTQVPEIKRGP
jgi:hypothetical protein